MMDAGQVPVSSAGAVEDDESRALSFFSDKRRMAQTLLIVLLLIVGIYVLFPKIIGFQDALARIEDGDLGWIGIAVAINCLAFFAYVALFRGVIGEEDVHLEWRESYQITMAGLAATRLFSAGGAGGIVLTYWALRKAGMERRKSACRMVAFLVLLYSVYLISLVVFGILLRTGVLHGEAPVGLTIVPAGIAGALIVLLLLVALLPQDFESSIARMTGGYRRARIARRLATVPATLATGTRTAIRFIREPSRGGLALIGAVGFWAANIGVLWASFKAYGVHVPLGVVVQGFFVGMAANLFPFAPGGVGAVDAGMIGAFVLFGFPSSSVFAAVFAYRVIAFWLPIPPGIIAFFQLRKTVQRWEGEGKARAVPQGPPGEPLLQKVK
jgi:uncharacterized protein (TIRG00374 family)